MAIAEIARALNHPPGHVKYFSPEDECLKFFSARFLNGSVNSKQAPNVITVSRPSFKQLAVSVCARRCRAGEQVWSSPRCALVHPALGAWSCSPCAAPLALCSSGLCALVAAAFGDLSARAASPAHDICWPLPSTPAGLFFGNASGPYIELFVTARRLHRCPGMRSAYVSCNFSCQRSFV